MRNLIVALGLLASAFLCTPARAQYDSGTNALVVMQRTISITASSTNAVPFTNNAYLGQAAFLLSVTNTAGTAPTLDVRLQGSNDGASWTDITGGAFPQVATANTSTNMIIWVRIQDQPLFIRATNTVGGSASPAFTTSLNAVAPQRYR